jgi:hypothetical protein
MITDSKDWISAQEILTRHNREAQQLFGIDGRVKSERLTEGKHFEQLKSAGKVGILVKVGADNPRLFPNAPMKVYTYEQDDETHRYALLGSEELA